MGVGTFFELIFRTSWKLFRSVFVIIHSIDDMIRVICNKCHKEHTRGDDEFQPQLEGTEERSMGTESFYSDTIVFECDNCKNELEIELNFWEYPIGALNYSDVKTTGCIIIEEPDYLKYIQGEE